MSWSDKKLYERLVLKFEQLEAKHVKQQAMRDIVCELFRPDLATVTVDENGSYFLGENIFEGTAPWAARIMATSLQGKLISKNIDWIMYQMTQFELRGLDELDIWCQGIKDHMVSCYERSNVYQVLPNYTLSGVTTGSPVMFGEENDPIDGRIMWMPQHYKNTYVSYDKYNEKDGIVIKDPNWTAKQIYDKFCLGNTEKKRMAIAKERLSVTLYQSLEEGDYYREYTIYRAIFKVSDPLWTGWAGKPKLTGKGREFTWLSVFFEEDTPDERKDKPLNSNSGYFSCPGVVWDYDKKPWEAISRTPATYAIYDTQSQNQVFKQFVENLQMANRKPKIYLNTMENRLDFSPEGLMKVSKEEYNYPPKMVDGVDNINLQRDLFDMMSDNIKRWFHISEYQKFSMLAKENKQPVTALQIWQMMGEASTIISPEVEACDQNIQQIDARMMDIEIQAGRGPFAPDVLANITDIVISNAKNPVKSIGVSPRLISLLARTQQLEELANSFNLTIETARPWLELYPDLKFMFKGYETVDRITDSTRFPKDCINTKEEFQAIVDAVNEAKAEQQQALMAIEMAKASKSVSGPVDKDSILAGAGKVLAGSAA